MKQYKDRTNDDIVIIFYQSTKELARAAEKFSVSTQAEDAVNSYQLFPIVVLIYHWHQHL